MKSKIHPQWYPEAKISCACGHSFTAGSTKPKIEVEICSHCHPFFTGKMKFIDTQGRIEKFQKQQKLAQGFRQEKKEKEEKAKKAKEKIRPENLREMLRKNKTS